VHYRCRSEGNMTFSTAPPALVYNTRGHYIFVHHWIKSMRIKPDDVVAGFPARKIRKLLRQSVDSLSAHHATKILEIKTEQAIQLLKRLEQTFHLLLARKALGLRTSHLWRGWNSGWRRTRCTYHQPRSIGSNRCTGPLFPINGVQLH
jgi:hypothetical protein